MRLLVTKLQKVERVAFAPEGTRLFASGLHAASLGYGAKDTGIDVFDLAGGPESVKRLCETRGVEWFAPLPDDRLAVATEPSALNDAEAGFFVERRQQLWTRLEPADWSVRHPFAVSRDGSQLVTGLLGHRLRGTTFDRGVGRWTLSGSPPRLDWSVKLPPSHHVHAAAFAPDGRAVWSAEWGKTSGKPPWRMELVARDADTGKPTREPVPYPNQKIADLAVSDSFAVAHDGPLLFVYDRAKLDKKPKKVSNPAKRKFFAGFAIHPSGKWLAAAGLDGAVTLWDTATWKVAQSWVWEAGQARSICFSADGTLAAAGTDTGKIVVWDLDL